MSLPFLKNEVQRELVLRVQRACEAEHKEHRQNRGRLMQDCIDRGLRNSTVYSSALIDAEFSHFRRLAGIMRHEIFALAEAEDIHLTDADVKAISDQLKNGLEANFRRFEIEFDAEKKRRGATVGLRRAAKQKMEEAIHCEAVAEVSIRVGELRRKQNTERKKRWSERFEKLVWVVMGGLFGIGGTLEPIPQPL